MAPICSHVAITAMQQTARGLAEQKGHSGRPASAEVPRTLRQLTLRCLPGVMRGLITAQDPGLALSPRKTASQAVSWLRQGSELQTSQPAPHARAHVQQEILEPWEDRRHRLNGGRQQPNSDPASAASFPAAQRAEQPGVRAPRVSASRSPAFGGRFDARPGTHESRERLPNDTAAQVPHDADRGGPGGPLVSSLSNTPAHERSMSMQVDSLAVHNCQLPCEGSNSLSAAPAGVSTQAVCTGMQLATSSTSASEV